MTKFIFCAFLILAASAALAEKSVQVPVVDIQCNAGDDPSSWRLLDRDEVSADGKHLQIVERTITYPRNGVGREVITCIKVADLAEDGTGGFVEIVQNGVGRRDVTIRFSSQRSQGFSFAVQIYGQEKINN